MRSSVLVYLDLSEPKIGDESLNTIDVIGDKVTKWDGRCEDPSLGMFRKAVAYALAKGLTWDHMPELRSENGVMHAIRPSGQKLRLEDLTGWEQLSGYAKLVDEMAALMRARRAPIAEEPICYPEEAVRA